MKPYPAYKYSGEDWVGTIPDYWQMAKLKYAVDLVTEKAEDVSAYQLQIALENIEGFTGRLISNGSFQGAGNMFQKGDILFNKLRPYLCKAVIAPQDGVSVGELLVLRPTDQVDRRFILYRVLSDDFISIVDGSTYGAKMPRASWEFIGNLKIPLPPLGEQVAIANYLDRRTAAIDTLITKKERQIELLQERRAAVINQAVTQGLNPDAPMKDSGIEWIGRVPAHWKEVKLSYVATVFNGTTPSRNNPDYWENGTNPWLSSGKVNDRFVTTPTEYITNSALAECALTVVPERSVIMGMIGQGKTRGMSALLGIDACINQNLAAIVPSKLLDGRYAHYFFLVSYESIREFGRGSNQEALNCEIISAFKILLPPIEEQETIAKYIEHETSKIDITISCNEREIALVQEYRTALISAAVTGKIDVRNEIQEVSIA